MGQEAAEVSSGLPQLDWRGDETVVDVGGGNGTLLEQLLEVQPGLTGIVFDLPETVRDEAALGERITFVEGSFFERVPEGDVYILSTILHDWDDESATAILQTIRKAAPADARLLVIETILPEGNEPNGAKWLDLLMLVLFAGRERDDAQWRTLLADGGFEPVEHGGRPDRGAMSVVVGTAGHIDHGKTALVRALTGKDTDRLPEEQARGISIELGYAPLDLPDGRRLSLVDVPGHERFVRTMVAGATGIDLFLLVIDAGEGVRPQTREHLAVLKLLGVDRGVVAVTKADAVDEETLALAVEEARELVPGAAVVATSAKTEQGLDELRTALAAAADAVEPVHATGATRLFVDRVFTLHGIGTVATGTLWSGRIAAGDELRAEPVGLDVRVRSVEVHDRAVDAAEAGQRVAVSLPGIERTQLRRGDALVEPGAYATSFRLDVALEELEPIADGARVHVHHGTAEIPAAVRRIGERYAQLRLTAPAVAARGDRLVLRASTTVGGGRVVDPAPPRHVSLERLELLERGDVAATVHAPVRIAALRHLVDETPTGLGQAGGWVFSESWLAEYRSEVERKLDAADPLDPGVPPPSEPWAADLVPLLGLERRGAKLYRPGSAGSLGDRGQAAAELESQLGREPVKVDDQTLARYLEEQGTLVRVGDGYAVSRDAYEEARACLVEECGTAGSITLARFRDLLGVGRRTAQLLLERFDADGVTRRVGDERVLRRAAKGS